MTGYHSEHQSRANRREEIAPGLPAQGLPPIPPDSYPIEGTAAPLAKAACTERAFRCCPFPSEMQLPVGLTARLIAPSAADALISDAQALNREAFEDGDAVVALMRPFYESIAAGATVITMDDPHSSDLGRQFEGVAFFVYYRGQAPVATAGIYRYLDEPQRFWLGRIAVAAQCQGHALGSAVLGHIQECVSTLGGRSLDAYTRDEAKNAPVHRFYERRGFERLEHEIFVDHGIPQRIYRKSW